MSSDQLLKGKRKKKIDSCPNPLFLQWLTEWKDDAASKGVKSQYTYGKAIMALKKYPLCLNSGQECKFLENFGEKTCKMLDQKLTEYVNEYGTTEPVPGYLTTDLGRQFKKKMNKKSVADSGFEDVNFNNLRVPPPPSSACVTAMGGRGTGGCYSVDSEDDDNIDLCVPLPQPERRRQKSGVRRGREYIPQYRSGPYAIILTLFRYSQRPESRGYLSKRDLMQEAQTLADKSFTIPDPGSRYTAWSSMGTLITKGLVVKDSNPAKYRITDSGCALAAQILDGEKAGNFAGQSNSVNDDLHFTIGEAPVVPMNVDTIALPNGFQQIETDVYSAGLQIEQGASFDDVVDLDDNDNKIDIPGTDCYSYDEIETSEAVLQFSYINEQGSEVLHKDQAAVTVDEEISVGFLVKCNYEDLLMCGKRYKLDTSRYTTTDQIYAYLQDDDAPDLSTVGNKAPTSLNNHCLPHVDHISHVNKDSSVKSSQEFKNRISSMSKPTTSVLKPASISSATTVDRPYNIKDCKPKCQVPLKKPSRILEKTNNLHTLPDLPLESDDSQSATSSQVPSLSGDSQSQGCSQNAFGPVNSSKVTAEPQFVFSPGSYDVLLCVDNQEVFGGGSAESKKQMVRELEKNRVPHNIRPLNVGDFCWVAREKRAAAGGSPRELVLDYIVERKRMDDLAGSIVDGRFKEQKFRLKGCGLRHPIYLVEDYGSCQHFSIGEDALFQAVTNTQVIDNFYVKRTGDTKESAAYLTLMTRYIQSLYSNKTLLAVSRAQLEAAPVMENSVTLQQIQLLNFDEFNKASVKTKAFTVREMLGKQLCQIQGLTGEKAAAILGKYSTPSSLFKAYSRCTSEEGKYGLLATIKFGAAQRNIGAALSKAIYFLYNTTPAS